MRRNIFDVMLRVPRLNGISTPIGGISWDNVETVDSMKLVKKIFVYLEDKRVLFYPGELEIPRYCMESILKIREFLTEQLMELNESQVKDVMPIEESLRRMRRACQDVLTSQQQFCEENRVIGCDTDYGKSIEFFMDIVRFRTVFVEEMYNLSSHYGIEIKTEELRKFIQDAHEAQYMLENEKNCW